MFERLPAAGYKYTDTDSQNCETLASKKKKSDTSEIFFFVGKWTYKLTVFQYEKQVCFL